MCEKRVFVLRETAVERNEKIKKEKEQVETECVCVYLFQNNHVSFLIIFSNIKISMILVMDMSPIIKKDDYVY